MGQSPRDLGQIIFIDLRDRTGVTQVVFNHELNAAVHQKAEALRNEFVIAAIGTVKRRDADTINPNIPTGEVELVVSELRILKRVEASAISAVGHSARERGNTPEIPLHRPAP